MNISKKLISEIEKYCKLNNIEDIDGEINRFIQIGFNITRFGNKPFSTEDEIEAIRTTSIIENKEETINDTSIIEEKKKTTRKKTETTEKKTKSKIRIIKND